MGTNEIQNILTELAFRRDLTADSAEFAFQIIMNGGATPAQMGAFLMGLRQKGETVEEITAGAKVLRQKSLVFAAPENAVDTCGTGGDMKRTLNISTAAAIVAAAAGAKVVKHGNRSISSASGSADVLQFLGVNIAADAAVSQKALEECNLCFLMAPQYHAAMRHIAPVRLELGLRTIFNLLGPLANPAQVKRQVLGVYAREWVEPLAEVLKNLGSVHALVVHGDDGLDEITTTTTSYVAELRGGKITTYTLSPPDYGIDLAPESALKGQDAEYNAAAMSRLLAGEKSAYRDIVMLNAAAALLVAGVAEDLHQGVKLAENAIDSGKSRIVLGTLTNMDSHSPPDNFCK